MSAYRANINSFMMDTDTTTFLQRTDTSLPDYMHVVIFVVAAHNFSGQTSPDNIPDMVRTRELMKKVNAAGGTNVILCIGV